MTADSCSQVRRNSRDVIPNGGTYLNPRSRLVLSHRDTPTLNKAMRCDQSAWARTARRVTSLMIG